MPTTDVCRDCPSRKSGIFSRLDSVQFGALTRNASTHRHGPDEVVFYEGNPAFAVHCISYGRVKLYRHGRHGSDLILRILGPGEVIGLRAVLGEEAYASTAETIETATICTLPKESLLDVLEQDSNLSKHIIRWLAREVRLADDRFVERSEETVPRRTAHALLHLDASLPLEGAKVSTGVLGSLKYQDLAALVGTSPETLSRVLHDFERRNAVELKRGDVCLLDRPLLYRIARLEPPS